MVCGSDASNASCDILLMPAALSGRLHANREFLDKNQPAVKGKKRFNANSVALYRDYG
jgi:hypothetical protein